MLVGGCIPLILPLDPPLRPSLYSQAAYAEVKMTMLLLPTCTWHTFWYCERTSRCSCSEIGEQYRCQSFLLETASVPGGWSRRRPQLLLQWQSSLQQCREAEQPAANDNCCSSVLRHRHRCSSSLEQPSAAIWRMPANNAPVTSSEFCVVVSQTNVPVVGIHYLIHKQCVSCSLMRYANVAFYSSYFICVSLSHNPNQNNICELCTNSKVRTDLLL